MDYKHKYLKYKKKYLEQKEIIIQTAGGHSDYFECVDNDFRTRYRIFDAYSSWLFIETPKYFFKIVPNNHYDRSKSNGQLQNEYMLAKEASRYSKNIQEMKAFGKFKIGNFDEDNITIVDSNVTEPELADLKKIIKCITDKVKGDIEGQERIFPLLDRDVDTYFMVSENLNELGYRSVQELQFADVDNKKYETEDMFQKDLTVRMLEIIDSLKPSGILHNDLKLQNIYYNPILDIIKIMDFGDGLNITDKDKSIFLGDLEFIFYPVDYQ